MEVICGAMGRDPVGSKGAGRSALAIERSWAQEVSAKGDCLIVGLIAFFSGAGVPGLLNGIASVTPEIRDPSRPNESASIRQSSSGARVGSGPNHRSSGIAHSKIVHA